MPDPTPAAPLDVAIVGGGIAGLSAAYELQRRGHRVRVLERGDRSGGVITTERFDGWVIDGGPDALLIQKPAAIALCRELGLADRLVPTLTPRTAYILRRGHLHPLVEGSFLGFPLTAGALARSSLFSVAGRLRMAAEVVVPRGAEADDESIASFIGRRFGREAVDYLAEPLLAGIHAGNVDRLSIRALFPRLREAEQTTGSVIRAFRALRVPPSPRGAFLSLPGGIAELSEALAAALAPGTIALRTPATGLRRADPYGGGYLVETADGPVAARAVILAAPAYATAGILRGLDPALAALCEAVPYASTATVAFGFRADQIGLPMRGSGFVVPRAERNPLLAATWVSAKWPGRAPAGHVLLRAFLGGGRDPLRLDAGDADLVALARTALTPIMRITGDPVVTRLFRWTRQSPQYEVGHLARLAEIETRAGALPGVYLTGSGFRAIGIPDTIADARDTAVRVAESLASATPATGTTR